MPEDCDYKAAPEAIQKLVIDKVNYELEKILTGITLHDLEKEYQTYVDYGQDMYCLLYTSRWQSVWKDDKRQDGKGG